MLKIRLHTKRKYTILIWNVSGNFRKNEVILKTKGQIGILQKVVIKKQRKETGITK